MKVLTPRQIRKHINEQKKKLQKPLQTIVTNLHNDCHIKMKYTSHWTSDVNFWVLVYFGEGSWQLSLLLTSARKSSSKTFSQFQVLAPLHFFHQSLNLYLLDEPYHEMQIKRWIINYCALNNSMQLKVWGVMSSWKRSHVVWFFLKWQVTNTNYWHFGCSLTNSCMGGMTVNEQWIRFLEWPAFVVVLESNYCFHKASAKEIKY